MVGTFRLDANASPPYDGRGWAPSSSDKVTNPTEAIIPYTSVYNRVVSAVKNLSIDSASWAPFSPLTLRRSSRPSSPPVQNDIQSISLPYLRAVSRIRDQLRLDAPSSPRKKDILNLCDEIRDTDLTNLGVYLDDRPDGQPLLIKFVPKEELIAQREEKAAKERERAAQKEEARKLREKAEEEKKAKASVSPFRRVGCRWVADEDQGGEDMPKSTGKKLKKDWDRQKKLWEEYGGKK
jgi:cysteinyl-tRNA synthetase